MLQWSKELVESVSEMSNEEIYATLVELGQIVGPVVGKEIFLRIQKSEP
jgi:hypothetical protein